MIVFGVTCSAGHGFDGWFQSAESFEQQLQAGLVSCPNCGSVEIRRVPSAVHLGKATMPAATATAGEHVTVVRPQGKLLGAYQQLVSAIIAGSEDVGKEFASEARKWSYSRYQAGSHRVASLLGVRMVIVVGWHSPRTALK